MWYDWYCARPPLGTINFRKPANDLDEKPGSIEPGFHVLMAWPECEGTCARPDAGYRSLPAALPGKRKADIPRHAAGIVENFRLQPITERL